MENQNLEPQAPNANSGGQEPALQIAPTPQPISNSDMQGSKSRSKSKKLLIFAVILIIFIAFGAGGTFLYMKKQATSKVRDLSLRIKQQEINGAKDYVNISNELGNLEPAFQAFSNDPTASSITKFKTGLTKLNDSVQLICKKKSAYLTKDKINSEIKGLLLSANQKDFISQKADIQDKLSKTQFSPMGGCNDASLIISFFNNYTELSRGMIVFQEIDKNPANISQSQLNVLKSYTTFKISDEENLKKTVPQTVNFLRDLGDLLANSYYTLQAQKTNDTQNLIIYAKKVIDGSNALITDTKAVDKELKDLDASISNSTIEVSKQELAIIEKYSNSKFADVDATLPGFRIADSDISLYSTKHDSSYPAAANVNQLASVLSTTEMDLLKNKKILDNLSYSSFGSKHDGYSLSTTLKDGTTLSIEINPSI